MPQHRKHTVIDCESKMNWFRDSDHIPLAAKIKTNMKRSEKKTNFKAAKKYYTPNKDEKYAYNKAVKEKIETILQEPNRGSRRHLPLEEWISTLEKAAENKLKEVDPSTRKDYIARDT